MSDDAIDALISRHLDGDLDADGYARLDAWLAGDPDHQRHFLRTTSDHWHLHHAPSSTADPNPAAATTAHAAPGPSRSARAGSTLPPRRTGRPTGRTHAHTSRHVSTTPARWVVGVATVAVLVVLGAMAVVWHADRVGPLRSAVTSPVAHDDDQDGPRLLAVRHGVVQRSGAAIPLILGMRLHPGDHLRLSHEGAAELVYEDRTRIQLDADTAIAIPTSAAENATASSASASPSRGADVGPVAPMVGIAIAIDLDQGRMSAEVSPQQPHHPAIVRTPQAIVQVIGTALAVECIAGETQTEVQHGRILVARRSDGAQVPVAAGECALIAPDVPLRTRPIGSAVGRTLTVGPGQAYAGLQDLPALAAGDAVEIHAGTFRGGLVCPIAGTQLRPVTIRGVPTEMPIIDGDGVDLSGIGSVSRALIQISGGHYCIDHLAFINARNHQNASALRLMGSGRTEIRDCHISHCDGGIYSDSCAVDIADCDIGWCGVADNAGYCHNLFLGSGAAVVRGCTIHHAQFGVGVKSAASHLQLLYNRIADDADGEICLIDDGVADHPDGELTILGNLVISPADRQGNHERFLQVASEVGHQPSPMLLVSYNTFIAGDPRIVFIDTGRVQTVTVLDNTICAGANAIARPGPGGISGRCNWFPAGATPVGGLITRLRSGDDDHPAVDPGFIDAEHEEYHLRPDSPCVHAAAPPRAPLPPGLAGEMRPDHEPPMHDGGRSAPRVDAADVGAFAHH